MHLKNFVITFLLGLLLIACRAQQAAGDQPKQPTAEADAKATAPRTEPKTAKSTDQTVKPPANFDELRAAIELVMKQKNVPAVGVAVVDSDGTTWVAGLGLADKEKKTAADEDTQFRIGSTSKMFAALALLKLQEEGRVRLTDKVHGLVPDVQFENPWEATHPVLVAHLLEHTTGWDDMHLPEYAHNDPTPATLTQGLDFHPHSRISRWMPGTRMSYCNSGPPVVAAIVEKITGQRFEDYVREHFFKPLGMEQATYFADSHYAQHGAALYQKGKPQPYWHISLRPAGAINASPKEMLRLVQFFIHRATTNGVPLISEQSLRRMETPQTTLAAAAGIETGYGLANYSSFHQGYRYQGHNGGVIGGLTELAYCPELGVGHAIMINSGDGGALGQIQKLIKNFETRAQKPKDTAPPESETAKITIDPILAGYYRNIAPRTQMTDWFTAILGARRYRIADGVFYRESFTGHDRQKFIPVSSKLFRSEKNGQIGLASTTDPLAGPVLVEETYVGRRISAAALFAPMILFGVWVVATMGSFVFAIVWIIRLLSGGLKNGPTIRVRLWPLLAGVAVLLALVISATGAGDAIAAYGKPSFTSVGIMLGTIAFAILSVWSVVVVFKERQTPMNRWNYWCAATLAALHLLVTGYLFSVGVIGLRTWA